MYTRRHYPARDLLSWSRRSIAIHTLLALIPVILYEVLHWRWLHLPWLPIALIGTAVAFLVSFKNNASYDRQYEARKIWGGIVNPSRTFGIQVRDFVSGARLESPIPEDEIHEHRRALIRRHLAWLTSHRYKLRQRMPWENAAATASNREYRKHYSVSEEEESLHDAIVPFLGEMECSGILEAQSPTTQIMANQSRHLRELEERGLIWEFSFLEMQNTLKELVALQGKNERIKGFPYPRQFATLNLWFVWIFAVLLPFGIMHEFDEIGRGLTASLYSADDPISTISMTIAQHFVWLTIPFSVVVAWIFHTMERIGEASENPFEGSPNDTPISTIARMIEIDLLQLIREPAENIPKPLEGKHGVQT